MTFRLSKRSFFILPAILIYTLLLNCCSSPSQNKLHIYTWGDFIHPQIIEQFEKRYACKVILDTYDSNESMYAKLKTGASGYDIAFPSNYFTEIMQEQGMLHPIDHQLLPHLHNLDLKYLAQINEPVTEYSIPYAITYTGIGYRKDKIATVLPSWNAFSRKDLRGRMTMMNDFRETIGAGLKFLGYSVNTTDQEELSDVIKVVAGWKRNLAKFESEQYKNGLASAEYLLVQGYGGDLLQVMQEDEEVEFLMPQEGLIISCDNMVIPKNAQALELAHHFIDFLLEGENAASSIAFTFYFSPNQAAYEYLPANLKTNPALFPPLEILEKSEVIRNVGPAIRLYHETWEKIKAR